jgi:hypothetical protein
MANDHHRRGDQSNICLVCCERIATNAAQLLAIAGWTNQATGEYIEDAVLGAVHAECYMRLPPAERLTLLDDLRAQSGWPE